MAYALMEWMDMRDLSITREILLGISLENWVGISVMHLNQYEIRIRQAISSLSSSGFLSVLNFNVCYSRPQTNKI